MAHKQVRYPRKLRQKLEKIADARDARAAGIDPKQREEEIADMAFRTLWQDFLSPGSVHLMHSVIDERRHKLNNTYHLEERYRPRWAKAPAPWES
jgi:hypothetical protein